VWSVILQPILHTSTEEAYEDGLLLCDRWQTSSLPPSNYSFRFSGLTAEHFVGVETTLEDVQQQLLHLFHSDTILLGHSLESDMRALKVWKCNFFLFPGP